MKLNSITNSSDIKHLIELYQDRFNDFEREFMVSMLVALIYEDDITQRQHDYFVKLMQKLKIYEKLV
jgi:hypothetical protein